MNALQRHHIVDLYVWVDDAVASLPQIDNKGGRPPVLRDSELLTILIWDGLNEPHKTLKATYTWIARDYADCFRLPAYRNFVAQCHRILPVMVWLLQTLLHYDAELRFADSTMLEVSKNHRADRPPADIYDAQRIENIVKGNAKVLVGDSHYGASPMRKRLWKRYGIIVVAPPYYKQRKQVMSGLQFLLLHMRSKIEATFDYLKEHMHLVSSFPRSGEGYFVHYMRILLGYQMGRVL